MTAPRLVGRLFMGQDLLLPQMDLALQPKGWTALLGPSGVGKSTLLRLIAGLPTAARFDGVIHNQVPVALMAQDLCLLPWLTVAQNVGLGARLRPSPSQGMGQSKIAWLRAALAAKAPPPPAQAAARLDEVLRQTDLLAHRDKRPAALSGGQRQRLALARTLMEDRSVVLLDEPFSALDARMRHKMQDLTARLLAGRTVLLVTHDPAEAARLADRIFIVTPQGLIGKHCPTLPPPRPILSPEVLACQAALMAELMESDLP